jgi:hypothetical protein
MPPSLSVRREVTHKNSLWTPQAVTDRELSEPAAQRRALLPQNAPAAARWTR